MKRHPDEVYSVTRARTGLSDDVTQRTKHYLFAMGLRVFCFVAGVACIAGAVPVPHFIGWIFIGGAVVLPYVAVVAANATRSSRAGEGAAPVTPESSPQLEAKDQRPKTT